MMLGNPIPPPAFEGEPDAESLAAAEVVRARHRLEMLDEVAELAMELARAQQRKALQQLEPAGEEAARADAPSPGGRERDAMAGFVNAARAVRVTLLLQAKLEAGLTLRRGELSLERGVRLDAARKAREQAPIVRQAVLTDVVTEVIEREAGDRGDLERLLEDAEEALDQASYGRDFMSRATGAIVAEICKDLGVTIDWSRWADEDWAVQEAETGAEGSPFAKVDAGDATAMNGSGAYDAPGAAPHATGPPS